MLKDKVALVTGASSGIGRAIALAMAREGAHVVVSDLNAAGGEETAALVRACGREALYIATDVDKPADCRSLVAQTMTYFDRLDVACNNAGVSGVSMPLADYPLDDWVRVLGINLSGVFYGMKYQIPAMLQSGGGSIINMASILGAVGFAGSAAYTAAKHGVVGLTQTAALEYGAQGVRVNAVGPGFIRTRLSEPILEEPTFRAKYTSENGVIPLGRLGTPEDVAAAALFLASDDAAFISGVLLFVDGGQLA